MGPQRSKNSYPNGLGLAALLLLSAIPANVRAETLKEPPVLKSQAGVLDILMIARPNTLPLFGLQNVGWIYDICRNPGPGIESCQNGPDRSQAYGGTRLALKQGDTLKVHLVNKLPKYGTYIGADGLVHSEAKHSEEPGRSDLVMNPTNIHTHGLIVEPRKPTLARPSYGDNVFVLAYNTANGIPQTNSVTSGDVHAHGSIMGGSVDYEIQIPANHPSGQYWFHPHVHGVALNQVSAGLAGIITIGEAGDYACEDNQCATRWPETNVRHLILKDIQVDNVATTPMTLTQEAPTFCTPDRVVSTPPSPTDEPPRKGFCTGQFADPADPNTDHSAGQWHFSVNGQAYPAIPITSPKGEIWRLTNESGSNSYDLHLFNDAQGQDMVMQVLSVDGVAISSNDVVATQQMNQMGGNKLRTVQCPATTAPGLTNVALPVCVTSLKMYPSSRVEVWVSYRGADNKLATPPKGARATFKTIGLNTGVAGDSWPSVDLADVQFLHGARPSGLPEHVHVEGHVKPALAAGGVFAAAGIVSPSAPPVLTAGTNCAALPAGWKRRIYYGLPRGHYDKFGLGYEVIDGSGNVVGPAASDVNQYDPASPVVCLPLAKGNVPVKEQWELVNLAGEDHNFHIHQTKFSIIEGPHEWKSSAASASVGTGLIKASTGLPKNPPTLPFAPGTMLHDNIPLPSGNDTIGDGTGCGGFDELTNQTCKPTAMTVEIAFSQVGDFVYHCHIMEHEDGGMMAKITVLKNP